MRYMLLIKQDSEYAGSNTWWLKGEYEAEAPEEAIRQAYEDTYFSRSRRGSTQRRDVVAVTGPDTVWQEFDVVLVTRPATIESIKQRTFKRDGD